MFSNSRGISLGSSPSTVSIMYITSSSSPRLAKVSQNSQASRATSGSASAVLLSMNSDTGPTWGWRYSGRSPSSVTMPRHTRHRILGLGSPARPDRPARYPSTFEAREPGIGSTRQLRQLSASLLIGSVRDVRQARRAGTRSWKLVPGLSLMSLWGISSSSFRNVWSDPMAACSSTRPSPGASAPPPPAPNWTHCSRNGTRSAQFETLNAAIVSG
mmetsp:Transcript_15011/g.33904  ORF Transcript_15011/g.33904 Transcript_15011/m.33904 type:complete len:215 (-) Transcript_15011:683-1327(-)